MPDRTPGPSTVTGRSANQRFAMRRSWVETVGTDEQMAIALTTLRRSRPSRSSSWVRTMACSSGVRSGTVDRRQWKARPRSSVARAKPSASGASGCGGPNRPDDGLGVADVDGEQHR